MNVRLVALVDLATDNLQRTAALVDAGILPVAELDAARAELLELTPPTVEIVIDLPTAQRWELEDADVAGIPSFGTHDLTWWGVTE